MHSAKRIARVPTWLKISATVGSALAVLLALGLGTHAALEIRVIRELRIRPHVTPAHSSRGSTVRTGTLRATSTPPSPTGERAALWVAWGQYQTGSGRSRSTHTVCSTAAAAGLTLADQDAVVEVHGFDSQFTVANLHSLRVRSQWLQIVPGETQQFGAYAPFHPANPGFNACMESFRSRDVRLFVATIPQGSTVTVGGCRSQRGIERCYDRGDFIALGGPTVVPALWLSTALNPLRATFLIVGACLVVLGAISRSFRLRAIRLASAPRKHSEWGGSR